MSDAKFKKEDMIRRCYSRAVRPDSYQKRCTRICTEIVTRIWSTVTEGVDLMLPALEMFLGDYNQ